MKKILAVILATSSVAVFADSFQDFNNNLYAQYQYNNYNAQGNNSFTNSYGIGGTFQTKTNIWANANINNQIIGSEVMLGQSDSFTTTNLRAGYAFQFFGDDDNGFQVIPYVSMGATDSANYTWGVGVQPEYRFLSSLKVSMGVGAFGYNGNPNSMTATLNGNTNGNNTTLFAFNVNPEVQYDISKMIMVSVGYNYGASFNADQKVNQSTVTAKVGYLF